MSNRLVLVSGASSGIGYYTAKLLHQKGYHVIGISRSYPKKNYEFEYHLCDITDENQIKKIKMTILDQYGHLDILINSAGMGISGPIEYTSKQEIKDLYDINVFGHVSMTNHMLDLLKKSDDAKIINVSSIASDIALPFQAIYSMTKASIDAYTKALSIELKPFNINVSSVLPGDIRTDFTARRVKPKIDKNDPYFSRYSQSIDRMERDEQHGMSPMRIAKKIYCLIKRRRMPLRTTVGFSYKLIRLLYRIMPERLVFWLVKKLYG